MKCLWCVFVASCMAASAAAQSTPDADFTAYYDYRAEFSDGTGPTDLDVIFTREYDVDCVSGTSGHTYDVDHYYTDGYQFATSIQLNQLKAADALNESWTIVGAAGRPTSVNLGLAIWNSDDTQVAEWFYENYQRPTTNFITFDNTQNDVYPDGSGATFEVAVKVGFVDTDDGGYLEITFHDAADDSEISDAGSQIINLNHDTEVQKYIEWTHSNVDEITASMYAKASLKDSLDNEIATATSQEFSNSMQYDFNGDGVVDSADQTIFDQNYPTAAPDGLFSKGDSDLDGDVDLNDDPGL